MTDYPITIRANTDLYVLTDDAPDPVHLCQLESLTFRDGDLMLRFSSGWGTLDVRAADLDPLMQWVEKDGRDVLTLTFAGRNLCEDCGTEIDRPHRCCEPCAIRGEARGEALHASGYGLGL